MRIVVLLMLALLVGCARTEEASDPPRSEALDRETQRVEQNEANAERLLKSGDIHAGQHFGEMMALVTPLKIQFVDRYAFINFEPTPGTCGLTLVAKDGRLVTAYRWGCEGVYETWFGDPHDPELLAAGEVMMGW